MAHESPHLTIQPLCGFAAMCPLRHHHEQIQIAVRPHLAAIRQPNRMIRSGRTEATTL